MKLRTVLNWAENNKGIKEIVDFYNDRFLGEVIDLNDLMKEYEDIETDINGKRFYTFLKTEMYKRGTEEFLKDKDYPEENYAGFRDPCNDLSMSSFFDSLYNPLYDYGKKRDKMQPRIRKSRNITK
jgi:hypothetical protein